MIDPTLLQILADRLAGLPLNGHTAASFPEPLATLWTDLDGAGAADPRSVFMAWAGVDQARLDLASEILKLTPGAPPPPDPWTIYTLKDAYKPRPPLTYLVDELLVVPSLSMTYGAPGVMKSMLVADLCVCVAGGLIWLPPEKVGSPSGRRTTKSPVLWCDFDNGKRRTDERFDALAHTRGLADSTPLYYVSMPTPWLDAMDLILVEELKLRIIRMGVKLVVIDNLGTIKGSAEENSGDMVQVMANLRYIAEAASCAVIVLHHQRKSNGTIGRAGETVRGHSSIEAALDLALLVERDEHKEDIRVRSTKTRDVDVFPFGALFHYTHRTGTKELEKAEFRGVEVEDETSDGAIKGAVIDVLAVDAPLCLKDLVAKIKARFPNLGVHKVRRILAEQVTLGLVAAKTGQHGAMFYDLP